MNPKIMVKELVQEIEELPREDFKVVIEFVEYLREKELEEEILSSKQVIKAVKKSQKAWREKKLSEFISWEELKKKYKL